MGRLTDLTYAIDFGTSNSLLAAASREGVHDPIPLDPEAQDSTILRSILYFPSMNQVFYGNKAIREFTERDMQGRLIRSIKKFLPIRSFVGTFVENRPLNLEDIIAVFLGELRRRANEHFGQDVDRVVLGRPARFAVEDADDGYAQYRLERAARSAGFSEISFCPEPLAAAFAFRTRLSETKTVLVADYGGGTSDYTIIRIGKDEFKPSDVLAIGGVSLAGDALDGAVMRGRIAPHFGSDVQYKVPFGSNTLTMPRALMESICSPADISLLRKRDTLEFFRNVQDWALGPKDREKMDRLFCLIEDQIGFKLFEEIDQTKRRLSASDQTVFQFDYPSCEIQETITRQEFDVLTESQRAKIIDSLDQTIRDAQISHGQIDIVYATGGTAKVPALHRELVARFGPEKVKPSNHFHSIVQGLAERARMQIQGEIP